MKRHGWGADSGILGGDMRFHQLSVLVIPLIWGGLFPAPPVPVPTKSLPSAPGPDAYRPGDGAEWVKHAPENTFASDSIHEVDESDYYEVVVSKRDVAVYSD